MYFLGKEEKKEKETKKRMKDRKGEKGIIFLINRRNYLTKIVKKKISRKKGIKIYLITKRKMRRYHLLKIKIAKVIRTLGKVVKRTSNLKMFYLITKEKEEVLKKTFHRMKSNVK